MPRVPDPLAGAGRRLQVHLQNVTAAVRRRSVMVTGLIDAVVRIADRDRALHTSRCSLVIDVPLRSRTMFW